MKLSIAWSHCLVALLSSLIGNTTSVAADATSLAKEILHESGVRGGFVVQVGIGDGSLVRALHARASYQIQGLDRNATVVEEVRRKLSGAENYGEIAVDQLIGDQLPYIDNMVNLLVSEELGNISSDEVLRVLVPNGVAYLKGKDGKWSKTIKQRPADIDEWSHYYHDATGNAVAQDMVVGPPRHLQWVGSPRYSRHHDRMASMSALVSTAGRLFYIMDEGSRISVQLPAKWKLIARDAFNGTVLWKRDIPNWQNHLWPLKSGPTQLSRRLVADGHELFATLGYDAPITCIDGATGETTRTYAGSEGTEEIIKAGPLLFAVVRKGKAELAEYAPVNGRVGDQALARELFWNEEPRILMAYEAATGKQLWAKQTKISPLTLSADAKAIYFHDGELVNAVAQTSGAQLWSSQPVTRRNQFNFNFGPRLLVYQDVVLFAGGDGQMLGLASADGKQLWSAKHPNSGYQSPQDVMVVGGLVWCAPTTGGNDSGVFTGRDPKTGDVKQEFPPNVETYWFHHRCYIAKATERFIMPSRTGIEFVSPTEQDWDIHHWVRGGCLYGVMPCNGLTYAPPHNCACYPEAKLFGFNSLAPRAPTRPIPTEIPEDGRLTPGPAYAVDLGDKSNPSGGDWPTFRHDNSRSGSASTNVPPQVGLQWEATLQGRLTAPVVAEGKVFVARTDAHTLVALDQVSGQPAWQYTIGARIDSPPTVTRGRVLVGGCDGWVYCLVAKDGRLAWRYRVAPLDRRTMAYEQQESLWPVHGSVLVRDDIVFAVAGRSAFLDGGLRLVRLDLKSGKKLSESIMDDRNPDTGNNLQEKVMTLQMPVGLPDILSADERYLYMKSQKFDFDGKRLEIGPHSGDAAKQAAVQRGDGEHIFAPMGFLDDSWYHRSYWVHGQSFAGGHNGYYQAGKFAPSGQILVKGNGYVFGYGRKPEYLRWTTTMERQLFAAEQSPPENPLTQDAQAQDSQSNVGTKTGKKNAAGAAGNTSFPKSPSLNPADKPITIEAWVTTTKPNGVVACMGGSALGFALTIEQGKPTFHMRVDGELSTVAGPKRIVGGWHHLVGVLDQDASMRLYVDGKRVAEGKSTKGLLPKVPANGFSIGQNTGSIVGNYEGPNPLTGIIDELRLYFAAASDDQVTKRFEDGSEMHPEPHLVLSFDDESFRDLSLFNNNGTAGSGVTFTEAKFGRGAKFSGVASADAQAAGTSMVKPKWAADVPIYVRAMALCGDLLFMAGPPDIIDEEQTFKQIAQRDAGVQDLLKEQDQVILGKGGGLLMVVSAQSGEVVHRLDLNTLPAWDGMALANEKVFMTTLDGKVLCLGK